MPKRLIFMTSCNPLSWCNVADVIAGRIAAGDMLVPCRGSRRRLVANYLAGRGLVEIVGDDLMRPLGARDGELFG